MRSATMPQIVLFEIGGVQFGIHRSCIDRIAPMRDAARAVLVPEVRQRVGFQGESLDLIDLSMVLERDVETPAADSAEVILLQGDTGLSLLADKVGETLGVGAEHLYDLPPVFTGKARICFPKVLWMEGTMALIIDMNGLPTILPKTDPAHPERPQQKAPPVPLDGRRLERVMMEKISLMIGQQVDHVVARTIADVLERHQAKVG